MIKKTKNSILKRWARGIFRVKKAVIGLYIIGGFILLSVIGPIIANDPIEFLGTPLSPPSLEFIFGTNGQGQDVFAQTVAGARQTLFVGFTTGFLVVMIGAIIGGSSGYFGGRTDDLLSFLINIFLVMPGLPLMVILASWLPPGPGTLIGVLVLTGWTWNARVIRSQMMTYRNRDFVSAAIVSGETNIRICLLYTSPSPRDNKASRMPSSA